jgi:MFS transporter, ACDE family, multidrug resistance protein
MYRQFGDARVVSEIYLAAGAVSLVVALFTPMLARYVPRRWLFTAGVSMMIGGSLAGAVGGQQLAALALLANTVALVITTVCFNAYVMDYIERTSLGSNESARLFYSGAAWAAGPYLGVWLMDIWLAGPFLLTILACLCQLAFFWYLRLGDGKVIIRARTPAANPLAYLPRFFSQKVLVAGWLFSVIRSVGWAVYIIYLPIFAVQSGLGDRLGGLVLSISNGFLFLSPLMLRYIQARTVRIAILVGFAISGVAFVAAALLASLPMVLVMVMVAGTLFLVLLDVSAGLPFLMSVKPSERTEMAAVYSTFRDVSAVVTPGFARLILVFLPITGVFAACGAALLACAVIALRLHPRLGQKRLAPAH